MLLSLSNQYSGIFFIFFILFYAMGAHSSISIFSFFEGVTLTDDQRTALTELEVFMLGDEAQVFILRGYAGTGKTFLMLGVSKWLSALGRHVFFTAPTGRAAKVLSNRTGAGAGTIHRAIYKMETETEAMANFRLTERGEDTPSDWVMVVDEASMLGDKVEEGDGDRYEVRYGSGRLLRDLIRYADFRQFPNTKMVLVGDDAQLPPVGMDFSPALSPDYMALEYQLQIREVCLREVVRQKSGSQLLDSATRLREALASGRQLDTRIPVQSGDGVRILPSSSIVEKYLSLSEGKPSAAAVILAHSNVQVTAYNMAVRGHYFPGKSGQVAVGDVLVVSQNAYHTTPELHNGEIVRVTAIGEPEVRTLTAPRGKIRVTASSYLRFTEQEVTGTFRFRPVTLQVRAADGEVRLVETVILEDWLECADRDFPWAAAHLLRRDAQNRFYQRNQRLYRENRAEYDRLLMIHSILDPYANALRCKFGYAITVHKAQGGEWKYVFADLQAAMSRDSADFYRWTYTALTRAKRCAWLAFGGEPRK